MPEPSEPTPTPTSSASSPPSSTLTPEEEEQQRQRLLKELKWEFDHGNLRYKHQKPEKPGRHLRLVDSRPALAVPVAPARPAPATTAWGVKRGELSPNEEVLWRAPYAPDGVKASYCIDSWTGKAVIWTGRLQVEVSYRDLKKIGPEEHRTGTSSREDAPMTPEIPSKPPADDSTDDSDSGESYPRLMPFSFLHSEAFAELSGDPNFRGLLSAAVLDYCRYVDKSLDDLTEEELLIPLATLLQP